MIAALLDVLPMVIGVVTFLCWRVWAAQRAAGDSDSGPPPPGPAKGAPRPPRRPADHAPRPPSPVARQRTVAPPQRS